MKIHPALLMIMVWSSCVFLYLALPFQLLGIQLSAIGFLIFILFISAFCIGTMMVPKPENVFKVYGPRWLDFKKTDIVLKLASSIALICFMLDFHGKDIFDLASAYASRTEKASALLKGGESSSTIEFQLAFLTYPAGFVYLARQIIYENKPKIFQLLTFGLLPIVLATLSMGGRAPLLYAVVLSMFALKSRQLMRKDEPSLFKISIAVKIFKIACLMLVPIVAIYYFSAVFIVRAEEMGGAAGMFDYAELKWGIGFRGFGSDTLFYFLGESLSYLIFVFFWYLIQGFFIGNSLFSIYDGPVQLGIYGIDLVSAVMRRIDSGIVARNFDALLDIGVYGFFPSAFGSLYVDFSFGGLVFCILWGAAASLVYQRMTQNLDARWYLISPFVTVGVFFSLINTPLGFTNGLVTHIWLIFAFILSKDIKATILKKMRKF